MTFLTIFLVLVGINVALVVVSLISVSQKTKTSSQKLSKQPTSVITGAWRIRINLDGFIK